MFPGQIIAGTPFKTAAWDTLSSGAMGGLICIEASERASSLGPEREAGQPTLWSLHLCSS
jgi:hypothetical protein